MHHVLKIYLTLLLISGATVTFAQRQGGARIDSLLLELPKQKEDTNKVKILTELARAYPPIDPDKGIMYARQGVVLAEKLEWEKGLGALYNSLGVNYGSGKSDYPRALENYAKALKFLEKSGNIKGVAAVTCNMGLIYMYQGDNPRALEYYFKALKLDEEHGLKQFAANVTVNIGIVYKETGDYKKALEYFSKGLKINEELGSNEGIAITANSIGTVYADGLADYPKAHEYFFKSLALFEELGNTGGMRNAMGNIGMVYTRQKNYTMAIGYIEGALKLSEAMGNKSFEALHLCAIGELYVSILEDTVLQSGRSKDIAGAGELPRGKYRQIPSIPKGKSALLDATIKYVGKALAIAEEINEPQRMQQCYQVLVKAYKLSGNYKMALAADDNLRAIKDSLFSVENKETILRMTVQNEFERQRMTDSLKTDKQQKLAAMSLQRQRGYKYMGIAGIALLLGFSFFITKERKKSEEARKKTDGLLLNILPGEVAEELKSNGTTTARHFDDVTVLFTDFVNFTSAAENMSAQSLIDELHTCFKAFDEITSKYRIEKIKTIGDAYLAVCGLPKPVATHAENVVRAAIEINTFMQDRHAKLGRRTFEIRVGIHSGSVVAGIVGVKKFAYDIWGDTVDTAARMEQNSEAGCINISGSTYELVRHKFNCEYKGDIKAAGKGALKMYYVSA